MMLPGAVINSGSHLDEHHQIVRSEIECVARAAKVETAVRSKTPLGVLAGMPFMLLLRAIKAQGARVASCSIMQGLIVVGRPQVRGNAKSRRLAVCRNDFVCLRPQSQDRVDRAE